MDFVADQLADGRRFRTLTVLGLFTRECLDLAVGRSLTDQAVARALARLRFDRGLPQRIYCDNGTEFVSAAMDLHEWRHPRLQSPWQADRRRGDRIVQRAISIRMPERTLVPFTGGCGRCQ